MIAQNVLHDGRFERPEFRLLEARKNCLGTEAYVRGSRLGVWWVVGLWRLYGNDVSKTAEHLCMPAEKVQAALEYARAFPDEIEAALAEQESHDFVWLKSLLPNARIFPPEESLDSADES
jgi:uncharacterized protein (DUF433 family)